MTGWTRANLRHALSLLWQGRNPATKVYESIGPEFFLAPAPGWLNLGLWEGGGDEAEAPLAVRRLVSTLAEELPRDGTILDVGNGLGAQDPVITEVARPRRLVAINITESQLRAGRRRLEEAGAAPVVANAVRLPVAAGVVDGVISVEAAFHFPSRRRFFEEARRVLRPGGILAMSDVPVTRLPHGPRELFAGLVQLRLWGLRAGAAQTAEQIVGEAERAGFGDVRARSVAERVIDPALALAERRLAASPGVPVSMRIVAGVLVSQARFLRRRRVLDYLLLRATAA